MKTLMQISAGTGPHEVARFVALLGRRLEQRCAELELRVSSESRRGPPDAPRSLVFRVEGGAGLARLRAEEEGTHALVARSPVRAARGRKRWFAGVTFRAPVADAAPAIRDVEVTACRSGGPGGQNVNKRSTAVRLRHAASGLALRVDSERRQSDNRRLARERLADALARQHRRRVAAAAASARHDHYQLVRGLPVRTYRLGRTGELEELR